jgi:hypothetical protein
MLQYWSFWARSPFRVFILFCIFSVFFAFYWQQWSFWARSPCRVPRTPGPVPLFTTSWDFFVFLFWYEACEVGKSIPVARIPGPVPLFSFFLFLFLFIFSFLASVSHPRASAPVTSLWVTDRQTDRDTHTHSLTDRQPRTHTHDWHIAGTDTR